MVNQRDPSMELVISHSHCYKNTNLGNYNTKMPQEIELKRLVRAARFSHQGASGLVSSALQRFAPAVSKMKPYKTQLSDFTGQK